MNKATVVIGEASETESEEEPLPSETSGHVGKIIKTLMVLHNLIF